MWDIDTDAYSGDPMLSSTVGITPGYDPSLLLPGDVSDQQQMAAWNPQPAQDQGAPWWAGIAAYGITRAIDNAFPNSPSGIYGNVYPGSLPGYNGRTLTQRPLGAGGGVATARGSVQLGGNPIMLLLLVGAAVLILK